MKIYQKRSEVPKKYQWDLTDYFASDEEWQEVFQKEKLALDEFELYRGKVGDGHALEDLLNQYFKTISQMDRLYVYAMAKNSVDLANSVYISFNNQINFLISSFEQKTAFIQAELLALSPTDFKNLFEINPNLNSWRSFLERVYREKDHILTVKEEQLISILTTTMGSYEEISNSLINNEHNYGTIQINGVTEPITSGSILKLKRNRSQRVRKNAYIKFSQKLQEYADTECALLYNHIQNAVLESQVRHYKNPLDAHLFSRNIPKQVYDHLLSAAYQHVSPLEKFYQLLKKTNHLKQVCAYDTLLPLTANKKEYTIEEAQTLIKQACAVLGKDYQAKLDKVFLNHQVDYCTYKGKMKGGWTSSCMGYKPLILMNFDFSFDAVTTLAHEIGHLIHHECIREHQFPWCEDISTLVAEIASLTNEFLLAEYVKEHGATKEEKLAGLENAIQVIRTNFYGAVMEGHLELKMYEKVEKDSSLTKEDIQEMNRSILKHFLDNSVQMDEYSLLSWTTRSHYFMDFYLFSYAICVSVAAYLAKEIVSGNQSVLDDYLLFLTKGNEQWPKDVFQSVLHLDITDQKLYEHTTIYFEELIDEYENILKEK